MTAALYALRSGKRVLVLEKNGFGGQITYSPKVENYPGTKQMSGNEFADRLLDQITELGAEVQLEEVLRVEDGGARSKTVVTADGNRYTAGAVILATGVKHRRLGVPGEEELIGNGISFCAVCDGAFYKGRAAAIVGGGNSALQEALLLAETCRSVTVIQNLDFLTGEAKLTEALLARKNIRVLYGTVVTGFVTREDELAGVRVKDSAGGETELAVDGLFIAVGLEPENSAFASVAALDDRGYFAAGEDCLSGTQGVFVAGDCRAKSVRQITTAVSDGAAAAVAACRYLG
jgi:thioredoxin reductase (NADPH)